jgi:hypothetical protein
MVYLEGGDRRGRSFKKWRSLNFFIKRRNFIGDV